MVTDRIKEALDTLESYLLLEEPGSQSREVGEAVLKAARSELARCCDEFTEDAQDAIIEEFLAERFIFEEREGRRS